MHQTLVIDTKDPMQMNICNMNDHFNGITELLTGLQLSFDNCIQLWMLHCVRLEHELSLKYNDKR